MKITNQFPNYEVIGLSKEENKKFWIKENEFFKKYLKFFNWLLAASCIVFNSHLFFVKAINESVNIYALVLVNSIHAIHNLIFLRSIFHIFYSINIFYLILLNFLFKKFNYLIQKIEKLKSKPKINNQKLSKLIHDINFVYLEVVKMNEYFAPIIGVNFTFYILVCVITTFGLLSTDVVMFKTIQYLILIFLYILVIYLCSNWANSVSNSMNRVNFLLQTISFRPGVALANKKRINLISFILQNKQSGFTCFHLKLTSYVGLVVSWCF